VQCPSSHLIPWEELRNHTSEGDVTCQKGGEQKCSWKAEDNPPEPRDHLDCPLPVTPCHLGIWKELGEWRTTRLSLLTLCLQQLLLWLRGGSGSGSCTHRLPPSSWNLFPTGFSFCSHSQATGFPPGHLFQGALGLLWASQLRCPPRSSGSKPRTASVYGHSMPDVPPHPTRSKRLSGIPVHIHGFYRAAWWLEIQVPAPHPLT
jgi:hypothetical protein